MSKETLEVAIGIIPWLYLITVIYMHRQVLRSYLPWWGKLLMHVLVGISMWPLSVWAFFLRDYM